MSKFSSFKKSNLYCFALLFLILFIFSGTCISNSFASQINFIDRTVEAGMSYPLSPSYGLSWGDFNNDNLIDIIIKNHLAFPPSLYQNIGNGKFIDISDQVGFNFLVDAHGASWGDLDNDGDLDLSVLVGAFGGQGEGPNYLLLNEGNGHFIDIAGSAGVTDPKGRGRTPLWFDYNNDGRLDLFITNYWQQDGAILLFRNNGNGTFLDVTGNAGFNSHKKSALGAFPIDINGDALMDIILSSDTQGITVYLNEGDETFRDITSESGLSDLVAVRDLALGDYDNDSDVDIYVCSGPAGFWFDYYETDSNHIYYRFNVTPGEKGFGFEVEDSLFVQFDLYFWSSKIEARHVYIGRDKYNPSDVPFTLDSDFLQNHGEPEREKSGIYIWFSAADRKWHIRYNLVNGGVQIGGILSTPGSISQMNPVGLNIDHDLYSNKLFKNSGIGNFTDVTDSSGLGGHFGASYSGVFEDFDNDGDLDLYVVYAGGIFNRANRLYENDGKGGFVEVAEDAGAMALVQGRGESVSVADYNNDGYQDMIILNGLENAPFYLGQRLLLCNQTTSNSWLQIKQVGIISNRNGIGSTLKLEAGSHILTRQQTGGMHCFSQNSQILQFGLGQEKLVDRITIRWPSGVIQKLYNVDVNQRLVIKEPPLVSLTLSSDSTIVSQGGILEYEVTATNNSVNEQSFLFATNVTLPNGNPYPPLSKPLFFSDWVALAPYETITKHIDHEIPPKAPQGGYVYNGYVGKGKESIWDQDRFEFTVVSSRSK